MLKSQMIHCIISTQALWYMKVTEQLKKMWIQWWIVVEIQIQIIRGWLGGRAAAVVAFYLPFCLWFCCLREIPLCAWGGAKEPCWQKVAPITNLPIYIYWQFLRTMGGTQQFNFVSDLHQSYKWLPIRHIGGCGSGIEVNTLCQRLRELECVNNISDLQILSMSRKPTVYSPLLHPSPKTSHYNDNNVVFTFNTI